MKLELASRKRGWLKKTGQTTAYTPAGRTSVDDGASEIGLSPQYSVLTTGQYSGTTAITIGAQTDTHSNNCAIDHITRLMWNNTRSASVFGTGAQDLLWDATAGAGDDIFAYCDAANLAGLSGFSDWRVPNIRELESLVDYEAASANPDATAFPGFSNGSPYWSSTTRPNSTTNALAFGFASGVGQTQVKTTTREPLLLVRTL